VEVIESATNNFIKDNNVKLNSKVNSPPKRINSPLKTEDGKLLNNFTAEVNNLNKDDDDGKGTI
jgi:hypothetical protein